MVFGMVLIAKELIPLFLGEGFEKSVYIMYTISPIIILIGLSNVIGMQYLLPTKKQKQFTISVVIGAIINLILNFMFIPKLLSIGAAIGTVVAETTVTAIQLYFIKDEYNIKEIFIMSVRYLISAIIMFIVMMILNRILLRNISVISNIIINIFIGIGIYCTSLFIMRDKFFIELIKRILKKVENLL